MPFTEAIAKDVRFGWNDLMFWIFNGFRLPSIVVFPDFPSKRTTIFKIAKSLRYRLTNKRLRRPELVLFFHDSTHADNSEVKTSFAGSRILNVNCTDISKKNVDLIHRDVFGYNTFIDPKEYRGIAVAKSDLNAMHDGREVMCPIASTDDGIIYQVLIDNRVDNDFVVDLRVVVMGSSIPVVYHKFKKMEERFTNVVDHSALSDTDSNFSKQEQEFILNFCKRIGADFCELDVLRNSNDQRIYIIDVNKTPYGPPAGLTPGENKKAVALLSTAFRNQFLS